MSRLTHKSSDVQQERGVFTSLQTHRLPAKHGSGIRLGVGWGQSMKMPIRGESLLSSPKWSFVI